MFRFSLQEGATHPPIDNVSKIVGIFGVIVRDTEGVDCPLDSSSVCVAEMWPLALDFHKGRFKQELRAAYEENKR